ncbi:hypothetical protein [Paludibacterium purpuratum]|uniref:Uncharacterized protein n=1 Tax=Paludibacterium purpuratum TaxID=1144873 RepID=A0A4R7B5U0_9NEIS|nr:hypothetical protein [Paludibacterium purpuratum]TDR79783.1 hypothetical protein DFP86_107149 [Paludibacterium purpuratum]
MTRSTLPAPLFAGFLFGTSAIGLRANLGGHLTAELTHFNLTLQW